MLPDMRQPGSPYLRHDRFGDFYLLNYFRRMSWRDRWKWRLCIVVLAFSLSWVLYLSIRGDEPAFASGPIATQHAQAEVQCRQCHERSFQPMKRLFLPAAHSVRDDACIACHQPQGGDSYHTSQSANTACASCHREHRGELVLARVKDAYCTQCHAQLALKDGTASNLRGVTSFVHDHPEFQALRSQKDPGGLRFNHAVHLSLLGVAGPDGGKRVLQCDACHQPTAGGCYMTLPKYASCAECHPLSITVAGQFKEPTLAAAVAAFSTQPAPHVEPNLIRQDLTTRFNAFALQHPAVLKTSGAIDPVVPLPGKPAPRNDAKPIEAWVAHQVEHAEKRLFIGAGGCRYCHEPTSDPSRALAEGALPTYAKTNLSTNWMPLAKFDHGVQEHRLTDCTACHPAQYSQKTADVLMPKIEQCRVCHQPKGSGRSDCAECHRYHHADQRRGTCPVAPGASTAATGGRP
jgi:hypothetical protein